jgi:hypothetical protein
MIMTKQFWACEVYNSRIGVIWWSQNGFSHLAHRVWWKQNGSESLAVKDFSADGYNLLEGTIETFAGKNH